MGKVKLSMHQEKWARPMRARVRGGRWKTSTRRFIPEGSGELTGLVSAEPGSGSWSENINLSMAAMGPWMWCHDSILLKKTTERTHITKKGQINPKMRP